MGVRPVAVAGWLPWQPETTNAHADAMRVTVKGKNLLDLKADLAGWESGLLEMKVIMPANLAERSSRR
jgi:hypothetical protein